MSIRFIAIWIALHLPASVMASPSCHYRDWQWNVETKRVVNVHQISKAYQAILPEERDANSGCSVCREDQQEVQVQGMPVFLVCHRYASVVQAALNELIAKGIQFKSITGYRVGRTRGELDTLGNRAGFSNHSYGIALDINAAHNGLYDNCINFGPACRLIRGGLWQPGIDRYSLKQNGLVVKKLEAIGFQWGGKIQGNQKDFMHFSPTGY